MYYNPEYVPESMKRLISEWLIEYTKIVDSYNISDKTRSNRKTLIKWIELNLSSYQIGLIKPYEIAAKFKAVAVESPTKAKRLLIETKNMFNEAIIYDWIDKNPAACLKSQRTIIQRERLSFEDWELLYHHSRLNAPTWVSILLLLAVITGQRRSDLLKMKHSDIKDGNLLVTQQKTGIKLAIPLALKSERLDMTLSDVIGFASEYYATSDYLVHKHNGTQLCAASLSAAFERLVDAVLPAKNTSLHECRSLSERLYRSQGLNTRLLLGHMHQSMTDMYNDDRGLNKDTYTIIPICQTLKSN